MLAYLIEAKMLIYLEMQEASNGKPFFKATSEEDVYKPMLQSVKFRTDYIN